jgi:signal transduction histidine kinase
MPSTLSRPVALERNHAATKKRGASGGFGPPALALRSEVLGGLALLGMSVCAFLLGGTVDDTDLRKPAIGLLGLVFSGLVGVVLFTLVRLRRDLAATNNRQSVLQAELERRERFWASAAHDVKSHVAAIGLRAQIIKNRLPLKSQDEVSTVTGGLEEIRGTAARISSILVELQDIARLNLAAPLNLDLQHCDLVAMVRSAVQEAVVSTNHRRRIVVDAAVPQLAGEWDPQRLARVINNLLDNAIKYSAETTEVVVSLAEVVMSGARWARVSVTDQGLGIPEHELSSIFERFHRASNVPGRIPGTGLGLAGARDIVEQHGGKITAESEEGRGSTFTVYLPLAAAEQAR